MLLKYADPSVVSLYDIESLNDADFRIPVRIYRHRATRLDHRSTRAVPALHSWGHVRYYAAGIADVGQLYLSSSYALHLVYL